MRPLEIAGFLLAILPVLALLAVLPVSVGLAAALLSCGVLLTAGVWQGAYWQLVPLYAGVVLSVAALLLFAQQPRWVRIALATAVTALLVATATFTYILPMFRLPRPTGNYAVGTRILHLVDPHRMETHVAGARHAREIMVQVWYPAKPNGQHLANYRRRRETTHLSRYMDVLWTHSYLNAPVAGQGGPYPVLLFNPAWKGQRTQNTFQMEDLASHGFIVVAIDHTYNSGPVAFPDGRIVRTVDVHDIDDFHDATLAQQMAVGDEEVRIEAGDDSMVLDYLSSADKNPASPWFQHVDASNAGAFGHSFGGAAAAQTCYQDPRVKAAINMDGWVFGDAAIHGLAKPFMLMYEAGPPLASADLTSPDQQTRRYAKLSLWDSNNMKRTMQQFGGYIVTIRNTRHFNFADRALFSPIRRLTDAGKISPRRAHAIIEDYTLQFFSHYLLNKSAPLLSMQSSPYKEVQFENFFIQNASGR